MYILLSWPTVDHDVDDIEYHEAFADPEVAKAYAVETEADRAHDPDALVQAPIVAEWHEHAGALCWDTDSDVTYRIMGDDSGPNLDFA